MCDVSASVSKNTREFRPFCNASLMAHTNTKTQRHLADSIFIFWCCHPMPPFSRSSWLFFLLDPAHVYHTHTLLLTFLFGRWSKFLGTWGIANSTYITKTNFLKSFVLLFLGGDDEKKTFTSAKRRLNNRTSSGWQPLHVTYYVGEVKISTHLS